MSWAAKAISEAKEVGKMPNSFLLLGGVDIIKNLM